MIDKMKAIFILRIITGLTIAVGLVGIIDGVAQPNSIPVLGLSVPAWVLGASVTYMGMRYWRRLPEMEKNVYGGGGFSWENFRSIKTPKEEKK